MHLFRGRALTQAMERKCGWGLRPNPLGARYPQGTTHLNLNSGLFYIQANARAIAFMARIAARLAREKAWDQVRRSAQP